MGIKIFEYKVNRDESNRVRFFTIANRTVSRELFFFFKDNYAPDIYKKTKLQNLVSETIEQAIANPKLDFEELVNGLFKKYNLDYVIEWSEKFKAYQKKQVPYYGKKRKLPNP